MKSNRRWTFLKKLNDKDLDPSRYLTLSIMSLVRDMEDCKFIKINILKDIRSRKLRLDCVNCDKKLRDSFTYCDEYCQQIAGTVRYMRKAFADNRISKREAQEGAGIRILVLHGGGYPMKERTLTQLERKAILERDGHKCKICGDTATDIDHIAGPSKASSNLRALCSSCNRRLPFDSGRWITKEENPKEWKRINKLHRDIAERIASPLPLRACDDYQTWIRVQPSIKTERKKLMLR